MTENIYLKNITGGKLHRSSLVFHFECDNQNHEFHIKRIHSKSVNLRLVGKRKNKFYISYLKGVYDIQTTNVKLLWPFHSTNSYKTLSMRLRALGAQKRGSLIHFQSRYWPIRGQGTSEIFKSADSILIILLNVIHHVRFRLWMNFKSIKIIILAHHSSSSSFGS